MNDFTFYFGLGWQHIISWDAADHILFLVALVCIYQLNQWKKVVILVTAFTIGHSLTLALSVYDILRVNSKLVELLIPITIIVTALLNFRQIKLTRSFSWYSYAPALFFGLIHGLGFANTIRFSLAKNESIGLPLLGFNLGLETGQIIIVLLILCSSFIIIKTAGFPQKWWTRILSAGAVSIALYMIIYRLAE